MKPTSIAVAGLFLCIAAGPAFAADAFRGGELAKRWCASCHIVDLRETGPAADRAPTFVKIAKDEAKTPAYLRRFLAEPHYPMPDLDLGRTEIDDLVAYIESLDSDGKKDR